MGRGGVPREVCESCMVGVIAEMVSTYSVKPDLAPRRIESIGYQIGHQLCERLQRGGGMGRGGVPQEVCESCVAGVIAEMVSTYSVKPDLVARRIGYQIGHQIGHQLCERYTLERPRFTDHLEAIKFICKDFWSEVFRKQIDNLKTNHRGTFVLQDNAFRWLQRIPADSSMGGMDSPQHHYQSSGESKVTQAISLHLYFPCGIIRGALSSVGIPCAVSADISNLPACSFVIRVKA